MPALARIRWEEAEILMSVCVWGGSLFSSSAFHNRLSLQEVPSEDWYHQISASCPDYKLLNVVKIQFCEL